MSMLLATGPVEMWVGFAFEALPQFLGFGERAPVIDVQRSYVGHKVDSGGEAEVERFYAGQSGRVSVDLVRLNLLVLDACRDAARTANASTTGLGISPGLDDASGVGTPTVLSGAACKLYLRFPYANKAVFQNPTSGALPAGYRFWAATLDPEVLRPGGTTASYKTHLVWNCVRKMVPNLTPPAGGFSLRPAPFGGAVPPSGPSPIPFVPSPASQHAPGGLGGWRLYDHNVSELAGRSAD